MTFIDYILSQYQTFTFVLVRVTAVIMAVPIFGGISVPNKVKIGLAFLISLILLPIVKAPVQMPDSFIGIAVALSGEILFGIAIGLAARLMFAGVETAGQVAGIQMGLGLANVYNPATQAQLSVFAQFLNFMAVLIFLAINGHHIFIMALAKSFDLIPPYGFHLSDALAKGLVNMSSAMFVISIKIAAPVIVALLLVNLALGILARLVPQMNIFAIGFPITISAGFLALIISMPLLITVLERLVSNLERDLFLIIKAAG